MVIAVMYSARQLCQALAHTVPCFPLISVLDYPQHTAKDCADQRVGTRAEIQPHQHLTQQPMLLTAVHPTHPQRNCLDL